MDVPRRGILQLAFAAALMPERAWSSGLSVSGRALGQSPRDVSPAVVDAATRIALGVVRNAGQRGLVASDVAMLGAALDIYFSHVNEVGITGEIEQRFLDAPYLLDERVSESRVGQLHRRLRERGVIVPLNQVRRMFRHDGQARRAVLESFGSLASFQAELVRELSVTLPLAMRERGAGIRPVLLSQSDTCNYLAKAELAVEALMVLVLASCPWVPIFCAGSELLLGGAHLAIDVMQYYFGCTV